MSVSLAPIPPIMRIADICALLRIGESKFYELRESGWFGSAGPALIEVQPPIDRAPRYLGEPFAEWLSRRAQARLMRRGLAAVK